MKILLLSTALLISSAIFAQKDSIITYTGVVTVDGATQEQLFVRARQWFNETWVSSKDVLQISDKETGELSGKGIMSVILKYKMLGQKEIAEPCDVLLSIWSKDGKYKYSFSNFVVDIGGTQPQKLHVLTTSPTCPDKIMMVSQKKMNEIWSNAKDAVDERMKRFIEGLKVAMSKKPDSDF